MQANFLTNAYQFAHGATPRGRGVWLFQVTCQSELQKRCLLDPQFHGLVLVDDVAGTDDVVMSTRGAYTYTEAKARLRNFLRGHFTAVDVVVCS